MKKTILLGVLLAAAPVSAQSVWTADLGDGKYKNPVLYADYSDPDVIRTGDDYWMTSSSFACVPGLQILHSTDLVNWQIVGAALPRLYDGGAFDRPRHGDGVWAPSIRFHDGWYYIFWGDPDRGIYRVRARDPRGEWSQPLLVKAARGIIDTCPLWDDDGRAYLVHGWAGSRAGFKSVLSVSEMTPDGERLLGEEVLIFDGHDEHPTVEGPKFYKRNGWYYVFAPAGGVKPGWQLVLRARSPWGPYECRKVLHQGDTATPGPHQGAWVEDVAGDSWFVHFVDMYAYGRVVHLQPMTWSDDGWCLIGVDRNGDGVGEPVATFRKPSSHVPGAVVAPAAGDEFGGRTLGLQWQWPANPQPGQYFLNPSAGTLRLYCHARPEGWRNLSDNVNLLLQKIDAPNYTVTTKLRFHPSYEGDRAGIVVFGHDYTTLGLTLRGEQLFIERSVCTQAMTQGTCEQLVSAAYYGRGAGPVDIWLQCRIEQQLGDDGTPQMLCTLRYSSDGRHFRQAGDAFIARAGHWTGAKIGFFTDAEVRKNDAGWIDIDYFRTSER